MTFPRWPGAGCGLFLLSAFADGEHPNGWIPDQKISVEEAVSAFAFGSAYAEFQEKVKGTIAPGKLAELDIMRTGLFLSRGPCAWQRLVRSSSTALFIFRSL